MRTFVYQIVVEGAESARERADRVIATVGSYTEPDLVVLPEMWLHGGFNYSDWGNGIALDDPLLSRLAALAAKQRCYLNVGSVVLRGEGGRPTNTTLVFGPNGGLAGRYDKIHLYGFDKGEAVEFQPGSEVITVQTPEATLGLAICFDLRFPELFRRLTDARTDVLTIPSAWPDPRTEQWRILLRARAIESQSFVCAAATAGTHCGQTMSGHSAIISPAGDVLTEADATAEVTLIADLALADLRAIRHDFPVLEWRRLDGSMPR